MIRTALLVLFAVVALGMAFKRRKSPAPVRPSGRKDLGMTLLGLLAIAVWFGSETIMMRLGLPKTGPEILYSRYVALLFGGLAALMAVSKRRNAVVWFAVGIWFVFAALIALLFLPKLHDARCPFCEQGISGKAGICPHCQRDIGEDRRRRGKT
ncbi:MAG: hypothetical protein ACE5JD_04490 [Candidatus Methylomirabilia bacterium]